MKFIVNGRNIKEYLGINLNRKLHKTYDLQEDRIIETDDEDGNITVVRFADIGDLIVKHSAVVHEDGNKNETNMRCKIELALDEKRGSSEVLLLSCTISEEYEMVFKDKKGETKKSGTLQMYFSKDVGMIESIEDVCEKTYFSDRLVESECVKTERVILQIAD